MYARRNPAPCAGRLKRLEKKLLQERDRRLKRQTDELKQSLIPADKAEIMMPEIVATFDCCAKVLYAHKLLDKLSGMNEPPSCGIISKSRSGLQREYFRTPD